MNLRLALYLGTILWGASVSFSAASASPQKLESNSTDFGSNLRTFLYDAQLPPGQLNSIGEFFDDQISFSQLENRLTTTEGTSEQDELRLARVDTSITAIMGLSAQERNSKLVKLVQVVFDSSKFSSLPSDSRKNVLLQGRIITEKASISFPARRRETIIKSVDERIRKFAITADLSAIAPDRTPIEIPRQSPTGLRETETSHLSPHQTAAPGEETSPEFSALAVMSNSPREWATGIPGTTRSAPRDVARHRIFHLVRFKSPDDTGGTDSYSDGMRARINKVKEFIRRRESPASTESKGGVLEAATHPVDEDSAGTQTHHGHHHDHSHSGLMARVLGIGALGALAEFFGGQMIGSLSIQIDSLHIATDLAMAGMPLLSGWLSEKAQAVVAAVCALFVMGAAITTSIYAAIHLIHPVSVPGWPQIGLAAVGLAVNAFAAFNLHGHREDSLTMKAAWIHFKGDAAASLAVIAAGAAILGFGWYWADAAASVLVAYVILKLAWPLLGDSLKAFGYSAPKWPSAPRHRH